jgi:hypothetical protein
VSPTLKKRLFLALAAVVVMSLAIPIGASLLQRIDVPYENHSYNGRFTFVRVKFDPTSGVRRGPYQWGLDLKWNHDYPQAERNLMTILKHHTSIAPNMGKSNIYALDDPELFNYPWAYLCEVGFWSPTKAEAESLRTYLLKGGFLVVDDFITEWQWYNYVEQMRKVMPDYQLVELDVSHPIFNSFFYIETLDFEHPTLPGYQPVYYGIFEDNDPKKRLMVIANYNHDIGDYWEWSGSGWVPIDISNEAFKLGVNYVVYGMTH